MEPPVYGVHVAANAIGNLGAGPAARRFGDNPIALMQANRQRRTAQLGGQQLPFLGTHPTKGERTHGSLRCCDVGCVDICLPSYHVPAINLERH